ncbi:hypothetical protein ACLESD_50865, partial [Pyxidicoccus sp. 3LFB2]
VSSGRVLDALKEAPDAVELAEAGLRRALLAGQARTWGLTATADEVAEEESAWWDERGVAPAQREAWLSMSGLDAVGLRRLCEERALERLVLEHAPRLLPDGPSWDEALADEARLRGRWAKAARDVAREEADGTEEEPTGDVGSD